MANKCRTLEQAEIEKAYELGKTEVLDKIRAEIEEIEEGITSYHNDRPWIFKDEVFAIIDKCRKPQESER